MNEQVFKQGQYDIPEPVNKALVTLHKAGFEGFLVGGCVRDIILHKTPKDWDITTNATPEEIQVLFPDSFYENDFGTVGVKTEHEDPKLKVIEITPYRLESKYSDHRHPDEVHFSKNIEDDLSRRDFTMNAIALDPFSKKDKRHLIDPFKGQEDIRNKIITSVGNAEERFEEDALRIMRAVRFSAELGFVIESETLKGIETKATLLKHVSRERIRDELTKLLLSDNPSFGMAFLEKTSLLYDISKDLQGSVGVSQETSAHKYDVFEHSIRSLQHAADKKYSLELRLAALFHDIGKPNTKQMTKSGKATFFGHEVVGAKITRETLKDLRFSREISQKVVTLVRWHMFFSDPEEITLSAVRRIIVKVGKDNIWDLMNLRKCDRIGTGRPKEQSYRFRKYQSMVEEALRDPVSIGMMKIDGTKLMELGIDKGPKIGLVLHALFDEVLEEPKNNNETFLMKRAKSLNELDFEELKELGQKGKDRMKQEDDKEIEALRKKHHVS
jgi:tRNA nucleotidyltransferase (CCA-adding enzyme)